MTQRETDSKETILLVDDEAGIRNLLSISLADMGYNVITAADGRTLAAGVAHLVQPEMWNRLEGDISFWRDEPGSMVSHKLGADYHVGELTPWWRANFYFSQYT